MKRLSRLLAVLALSAAVSCRRAPETSSRTVITRHLVGDPASLDPLTSTDEEALLVEALVFRPLVGIDGHRQPVPSLASSWAVSPDGLTYEFHLDPKFTWETGQPVTSDDVRFTLERLHDPKVPAPVWRALFEDLSAVETPDAATVRVRFSKPDAQRMVAFTVPVVSAAAYIRAKDAAETGRHPAGSGPYRLESWEPNQKVRLVRRDGAANSDGKFDEVLFRIIP
jgi:peptide/nickel transport system substrate-binding protein